MTKFTDHPVALFKAADRWQLNSIQLGSTATGDEPKVAVPLEAAVMKLQAAFTERGGKAAS